MRDECLPTEVNYGTRKPSGSAFTSEVIQVGNEEHTKPAQAGIAEHSEERRAGRDTAGLLVVILFD
jgi:hypothetical protein